MRRLYSVIAYLLAPAYCGALAWRGFKERGYWAHFGERFGFGPTVGATSVWVHAASAGEVQASAPLVRALRREAPARPLVLTTATPAGAARARALFGEAGVEVRFAPLDLTGAVRRFIRRARPRLAVVVEAELWPNRFEECRRRGIPLALVSARMSERSVRRYGLLRGVFERALADVALVAAQTEADAARFRALGTAPGRTHVVGNLKFDLVLPAETHARGGALRERHARGRPLWVAGSTHQGEEAAVLEAHARVRERHPGALLVIAPRHPPRFAEVASQLAARGVRFARRSRGETAESATEVFLLDTLGELLDFYAAADVVFVGGSLVPAGGHNLLEPAALARAIVSGPYQHNAPDVASRLTERGGLELARGPHELGEAVARLLASPDARARMGGRALGVVEESRGALARLLVLIAALAAQAPGPQEPQGPQSTAGPAGPAGGAPAAEAPSPEKSTSAARR
ncbi:MAG: lipid IV(A) 3-deoxy-D-manno-octulosonic acid transferase [Steroidobacteraceae bacterium]